MRSKRAKEYLSNVLFDGDTRLTEHIHSDLSKAVELVEQDAREKAERAYCSIEICEDLAHGFCPGMDGIPCKKLNKFLKYYDNELD